MKKKILLLIVAVQLSILLCTETQAKEASAVYTDCGSSANVTQFTITNCKAQPCIVVKGRNYSVSVTAIGTKPTQTLPYKVTTKISFLPVTLLKGNACSELTEGKCPVTVGEEFAYSINFNVKKKVPTIKTKVKALVVDDSGQTVICALISVKIK